MDGFKRGPIPNKRPNPQAGGKLPEPRPINVPSEAQSRAISSSAAQPQPENPTNNPGTLRREVQTDTPNPEPNVQNQVPPYARGTKKKRKFSPWLLAFLLLGLAAVAAVIAGYAWYENQLKPVDPQAKNQKIKIEIPSGATFDQIGQTLGERGLIRSQQAYSLYVKLNSGAQLKEGTCSFTPAESVPEIIAKLNKGCHDFKSVMFYPGATIDKVKYKHENQKDFADIDVTTRLEKAGFGDEEITAALKKKYDSQIFADKPAGTTLEGYVYGDTYYVDVDATVEQVLEESFKKMNQDIVDNGISLGFKKHGLNLYQGITLASIIQRELGCGQKTENCYQNQRKIAQVFLKRLKEDIPLGSDPTFIYAADIMNTTPRVDLDSPYNTRIKKGLPPGPIASPGLGAMKALADPAPGDDLFFLAGDDGMIYYAKDQAGHEQNIRDHCQQNCEL